MWLVYQDGRWTLKSCHGTSTHENFVIFHLEQNPTKIENEVAELLGVPRGPIPQLCPNRYAVIRTTRRTFLSSPACCLYFDCAEIARNDFYLVGTVSLTAENDLLNSATWPRVASSFSPVRSRVAESLYINYNNIYQELVEADVLPSADFYSHPALNHYMSNLFALPPAKVRLPPDDSPPCYVKPESFPIPDPLPPCSEKREAQLLAWNQTVHRPRLTFQTCTHA